MPAPCLESGPTRGDAPIGILPDPPRPLPPGVRTDYRRGAESVERQDVPQPTIKGPLATAKIEFRIIGQLVGLSCRPAFRVDPATPCEEANYVTFVIGSDGVATDFDFGRRSQEDPDVMCFALAIKSARFPTAATSTQVRYPFARRFR